MRYRPSSITHSATGYVLAAGVAWLGFLAAGMAVAGGFAMACRLRGLVPKRLAFVFPLTLVLPAYLVALWMAWVALAGGH